MVLLSLGLWGCQPVSPLQPPPVGAAKAVLLVLSELDAPVAAGVFDPSGQAWPAFSVGTDGSLSAALFACEARRLGLTEGAQVLGEAALHDLLPPPAGLYTSAVGPGAAPAWMPQAAVSTAVIEATRRLPLAPDARCSAAGAHFESEIISLPNDGHGAPAFVIPVDGGRTLAGARGGHLYLVESTGVRRLEALEGPPYLGGYRAPDGQLWLITDRGEVHRGTLETGFTVVTTTIAAPPPFSVRQERMAIAGPSRAAPFELFVETFVSDRIHLARYDGARWTSLADVHYEDLFLPAVAWIGPGEAVAIGASERGENYVLRYKDGQLLHEVLPGSLGASSIVHHPVLGTLVGRDQEGIDVYDGGTWRVFQEIQGPKYIRVMHPEGPGLLYAGSREFNYAASGFGQYQPSTGVCPTLRSFTDLAVSHLAPLGELGLVALTLGGPNSPMGVTIMRRIWGPQDCSTF